MVHKLGWHEQGWPGGERTELRAFTRQGSEAAQACATPRNRGGIAHILRTAATQQRCTTAIPKQALRCLSGNRGAHGHHRSWTVAV